MKVIATDESLQSGIQVKELGRVAQPGEVFEIELSRLPILTGQNKWGKVFVTEYREPKVEPIKEEVVSPKVEVEKPAPKKAPAKKPATKKTKK